MGLPQQLFLSQHSSSVIVYRYTDEEGQEKTGKYYVSEDDVPPELTKERDGVLYSPSGHRSYCEGENLKTLSYVSGLITHRHVFCRACGRELSVEWSPVKDCWDT